jgi:RND family efflux transporter MFP subunit
MSPASAAPSGTPQRRFSGWLLLAAVLLAALLLALWGLWSRHDHAIALERTTEDQAIPTVLVTAAARGPVAEEIILPGTVQAWYEAPIYARTSGYVKRWYTDIGTHVKTGQLLAEIDTPDVDDQLHQAEADQATAEANNRLAQSTAQRWKGLRATDSVSQQDADEKYADAEAKQTMVRSAAANVARLRQQVAFRQVVAPFDGVVTARETDVGALINAGAGAAAELFKVADTSRLRIYVQVPQTNSSQMHEGLIVDLTFAEHPGETFPAKLVRTAQALDPTARTLLVELQVDNEQGILLPGGYTQVHFHLPTAETTVRLPVSAIIFRADGLHVATLGPGNHVALKPIIMGRDFGTAIEILSGVAPGDPVIDNPPDSIVEGEVVRVAQAAPNDKAAK